MVSVMFGLYEHCNSSRPTRLQTTLDCPQHSMHMHQACALHSRISARSASIHARQSRNPHHGCACQIHDGGELPRVGLDALLHRDCHAR